MPASVLLDSGAILAILNRQDRWHVQCLRALSQVRAPLLTSEAVLTEVLYMVSTYSHRVDAAWDFIRSGVLTLGAITDADLAALAQLMHRYSDRPMDFADATLVHLAQRESLNTILTIDFSDFQTYRIDGRKRFRVLPDTQSMHP
jgi:predicted nucleic acid-binding protein